MKTKLYTLLTSLLMAAGLNAFGQELVSEFSHSNGLRNYSCTIVEATDGTLLMGSNVYTDDETASFVVLKYTTEGELLDSLVLPDRYCLWAAHPTDPETQVYASYVTEGTTGSIKIAFINADLDIDDVVLTPIPNYNNNCTSYGFFFFDTQNDIIASYWNGNQFHLVRIGLDGTLKEDKAVEGIIPPSSKPDTTVYYTETKLFNASPQQFSLLGDISRGYNNTWPILGYTIDDDFNRIDKQVYSLVKDGILVNAGMGEHFTSFDEDSYLLAARIHHGTYGYAGLIKFSRANHEPMQVQLFEGNDPYRYNVSPCDTKVLDDHNIYFTYLTHVSSNNSVALVRTTPDLEQIWSVTFPEIPQQVFSNAKITVLRDGRIALSVLVYDQDYTRTDLHVYIIHDGYDATSETIVSELPFTLYPNPVKGLLSLRFDEGAEPESVEIYNLAGCLVAQRCNDIESIDMNALSSGVYTLRVTMKDGTNYHEKIIKE